MLRTFYKNHGCFNLLLVALLCSAIIGCSMQKRLYRPGVHLDLSGKNIQPEKVQTKNNTVALVTEVKKVPSADSSPQECVATIVESKRDKSVTTAVGYNIYTTKEKNFSGSAIIATWPIHKKNIPDKEPLSKQKRYVILTALSLALALLLLAMYYPLYAMGAFAMALVFLILAIINTPKKKKADTVTDNKSGDDYYQRMHYSKSDKAVLYSFILIVFGILLFFAFLFLGLAFDIFSLF